MFGGSPGRRPSRATITMARNATAIPTIASPLGLSPNRNPVPTGTIADGTADTGANRSAATRLVITPQYCVAWARQMESMLLAAENSARTMGTARHAIRVAAQPAPLRSDLRTLAVEASE